MLKHEQMSAEYEKRIAALEAENAELLSALEYVALEHLTPHGAKVVRAAIAMARGHGA